MDGWNFQYEGDDAVGVGPAAGLPKRSATATLPAESRKSYIDSVDAAFTAAKAKEFESQGYTVIDGLFGDSWASAFRSEIQWLAKHQVLRPNETQFTDTKATTTGGSSSSSAASTPAARQLRHTKPHIHELDLHHAVARKLVPEFNALFERFWLAKGTKAVTVKLQYNDGGGGCFPLHYDNPGRPNNRVVTCLVYLNPEWKQGDGGEIQLVPFCGPCVTIPPLHDRLVVFRADRILHRVFLKAKHLQGSTTEAVDMLRGSGLQRLVARSVYKEAYEQSLVDCQGASAPCMVQSHQAQVQASERTPAVAKMVNSLRDLNAKHPQHQPLNQPK
eukprot:gene20180-16799_t